MYKMYCVEVYTNGEKGKNSVKQTLPSVAFRSEHNKTCCKCIAYVKLTIIGKGYLPKV